MHKLFSKGSASQEFSNRDLAHARRPVESLREKIICIYFCKKKKKEKIFSSYLAHKLKNARFCYPWVFKDSILLGLIFTLHCSS